MWGEFYLWVTFSLYIFKTLNTRDNNQQAQQAASAIGNFNSNGNNNHHPNQHSSIL